ncbi:SusC/RagA family TonB-linked outer membrane protein [Sphingobacterium kitahiroshimense]|uniref:SusC/RagA family TonB-linked outer membrane protein n=1 Tax=Sphingobacterium kitahiroshimense TaxID=470446 RepID=UPI003207F3F2
MKTYTIAINKLWNNLRKLFKPRGADILVIGKMLLLGLFMTFHMLISAQMPRKDSGADGPMHYVLRGTVVSSVVNKPLDGVSVRVEAEKARTSTREDGTFSLSVGSQKGQVKFTYVGYKSQEISYTPGVSLIVKLIPEDNKLDEVEVVSTGYQRIPKERATGSFEFVDNKLFNRKVSTDFVSRLEDVVPSISSSKLFADNRGDLLNINVRGTSTLSKDIWPLIVVDGIPFEGKLADFGMGNFNNINPNDIENITVLKDAASASIWGAQSGNGVIVITTKRGKFNEKTQVSFNTNLSIKEKPDLYYYPQMNTSDYIDLQRSLFDAGKYNSNFKKYNANPEPILWMMKEQRDGLITEEVLNNQLDKLRSIDMRDDFMKYIYRKAINQQYNVQLQSGGDKINSLFSAGYDRNLNSLVTSSYERMVLKSASQFKPVKNLLLDLGITFTESKRRENFDGISYHTMGAGLANYPYLKLVDENGNPKRINFSGKNKDYIDTVANGRLQDWMFNPLEELDASQQTQKLQEVLAHLTARYQFGFGLGLHAMYSYQRTNNPIEDWRGMESYKMRNELNYYANWNPSKVTWNLPVGDYMLINHYSSNVHQGRLNAEYNKRWKDRHELSVLVGYDVRQLRKDLSISQYYGYDRETGSFQSVQYGRSVPVLNGKQGVNTLIDRNRIESTVNRYVSYYANGSYTYLDRYIVSGSFRKDASNLFGVKSNDRGQPFWSIGGAYIPTKEAFFEHLPFQFLKFRATYGYNGNVNNSIAAYPVITIMSEPHYSTGQNYAMMATPPNPKLRWERVANLNFGMDFTLKGNRISGSVEYYLKNSKDLISSAPLDPTTGFSTLSINYANLKGRGWDISLHSIPWQTSDWQWDNHIVFSYNRTKVAKAYTDPSDYSSLYMAGAGSSVTTPFEGMDLYSLLTYKWAGLDPKDGSPQAELDGQVSKDYYAVIAQQVNDLENHGSVIPLYFGSFRNSVRYKNIELSFNIGYRLGHVFLRNSFSNDLFLSNGLGYADYAERWQKPGDEAYTDVPAFTYPNDRSASTVYRNSSALVENGSQIKLRDIQLSLQLPVLSRYGFKNCRLYTYFENIGTLWQASKRKIDAEYGIHIPDPKMYSLGLNFNL